METRETMLVQQITALTTELQAVRDTKLGAQAFKQSMTEALEAAVNAATMEVL